MDFHSGGGHPTFLLLVYKEMRGQKKATANHHFGGGPELKVRW